MMTPLRANGNLLEFTCQTCGMQEIDFTNRYNEDCLLYSKELQSRKLHYTQNLTGKLLMRPTFSTLPCLSSKWSALNADMIEQYTAWLPMKMRPRWWPRWPVPVWEAEALWLSAATPGNWMRNCCCLKMKLEWVDSRNVSRTTMRMKRKKRVSKSFDWSFHGSYCWSS